MNEEREMYSVAETARILGCTPAWVGREIRDGYIEARKIGRVWVVFADSVRGYVKRSRGPRPAVDLLPVPTAEVEQE